MDGTTKISIAAILRLAGYTNFRLLAKKNDGELINIEEDLDSREPSVQNDSSSNVSSLQGQGLKATFENLKLSWCKELVRLWIKEIEPHKRKFYPYSYGDISKPPWWPAGIPHKEPDHLRKSQRVCLLMAIVTNKEFSLTDLQVASEHLERKTGSAIMNKIFKQANALRGTPVTPSKPAKPAVSPNFDHMASSSTYPTPQSPPYSYYNVGELPSTFRLQLYDLNDIASE